MNVTKVVDWTQLLNVMPNNGELLTLSFTFGFHKRLD
jgi:hypothetical protein